MKNFCFTALLITLIATSTSCKKTIDAIKEEKAQDMIVLAMTNGSWNMTYFKENSVPVTEFNGYEFKYYANYTVDGIAPSGVTKQGNWSGDGTALNTSCDFPASANEPLTKLNGTWKITKNSWTFVEAQQIVGSVTKTMRLDKK